MSVSVFSQRGQRASQGGKKEKGGRTYIRDAPVQIGLQVLDHLILIQTCQGETSVCFSLHDPLNQVVGENDLAGEQSVVVPLAFTIAATGFVDAPTFHLRTEVVDTADGSVVVSKIINAAFWDVAEEKCDGVRLPVKSKSASQGQSVKAAG